MARLNLGVALGQKGRTLAEGDWDGAIVEFREALRLNLHAADAHSFLGFALRQKGDLDGAIAEYREALRLNPNDDTAHYRLGLALEDKDNFPEALQEYRTAYELNPQDPDYRKAYESLVKKTRQ
jgi:Flp pilus assembly protein TadD